MNELETVWKLVVGVGTIIAVAVGIIQGAKILYSNTLTSKLEARVKQCEEHNHSDLEHLKLLDSKVNTLEQRITQTNNSVQLINEGIQRIGKSQITLLHHFVTGNGQQEMTKEADDLTDFFITREKV